MKNKQTAPVLALRSWLATFVFEVCLFYTEGIVIVERESYFKDGFSRECVKMVAWLFNIFLAIGDGHYTKLKRKRKILVQDLNPPSS